LQPNVLCIFQAQADGQTSVEMMQIGLCSLGVYRLTQETKEENPLQKQTRSISAMTCAKSVTKRFHIHTHTCESMYV
jgi:hypothetical protein